MRFVRESLRTSAMTGRLLTGSRPCGLSSTGFSDAKRRMLETSPPKGGEFQDELLQPLSVLKRHRWKFHAKRWPVTPNDRGTGEAKRPLAVIQIEQDPQRAPCHHLRIPIDSAPFGGQITQSAFSWGGAPLLVTRIRHTNMKRHSFGLTPVQDGGSLIRGGVARFRELLP